MLIVNEAFQHREVYRPWGKYDSIDQGARFSGLSALRLILEPSCRYRCIIIGLSIGLFVKGTAEVRCGDEVKLLSENESTYIPLGELHQLYNPGKVPLEIIEVQSGTYLGEDDIVRFEDQYGRKT